MAGITAPSLSCGRSATGASIAAEFEAQFVIRLSLPGTDMEQSLCIAVMWIMSQLMVSQLTGFLEDQSSQTADCSSQALSSQLERETGCFKQLDFLKP